MYSVRKQVVALGAATSDPQDCCAARQFISTAGVGRGRC
jgi:hypothetical protein